MTRLHPPRRRATYDARHPYRTRAATQAEEHQLMDAPRITDLRALTDYTAGENMAGTVELQVTGNGTPIPPHRYPGYGNIQGWIRYGAIINGRRTAMSALITTPMIGQGTTPTYDFPFIVRYGGGLIARGHLLARSLGGSGSNPRNLVPMLQIRANIRMYSAFERRVRQAVLNDGIPVEYTVTPIYWASNSLWPAEIRFSARNYFTREKIGRNVTFSTGARRA